MVKEKRSPIANLPKGVALSKVLLRGVPYWRVRLGKRFTGGEVRIKQYKELSEVREFIFGDDDENVPSQAGKFKFNQPGVIQVQKKLGSPAFNLLTPGQLEEAHHVYRRLPPTVTGVTSEKVPS